MIKFTGVSKTYKNGTRALDEVDLEIDAGEFVFLIGPSGAGKTTLFKLLSREERPDDGQILFDGLDLVTLPRRNLPNHRRNLGVIFQDFKLLPTASVFENVALVLGVLGLNEAEIEEKVGRTLERVGLSGKDLSLPWQLSGGEKQRVAVARALVGEPRVVLADEPTAEVDPALTWGIIEILERANRQGTTVVVATHDSEIVNSLKRRVVKIDRGRITADENKGTYV